MDIDQCIEMINALRDTYKGMVSAGNIKKGDINRLKHTITEFELAMISMRKSVQELEIKLKLNKKCKTKQKSTV